MTGVDIWTTQFSIPQAQKETVLLPRLIDLVEHHREYCPPYARFLRAINWRGKAFALEDIPYFPVGLFKTHELRSISKKDVFRVLTSSGTTGQQVSRIALDKGAAALQIRALSASMNRVLGSQRLPMLIIDAPGVVKQTASFSARTAGVLGMMTFGRFHSFALNDDMSLNNAEVTSFFERFGSTPFLIFGFTFMVWAYFFEQIKKFGIDMSSGILIHSGGWKKLQDKAVDNATFKSSLRQSLGIERIYNFYGMVEQIGSVFLEGNDGYLHAPNFSEVIVRDPKTWQICAAGTTGVIQVLSVLPRSYPGHSLLTEDIGYWLPEVADAPWTGKRLVVLGRAPRAELRGCSDVHAAER
ncbi:Acyl-protein synthetase, LuxE [Rhodospirillaceae bacterium LM-1]|nr:Acyl-protein synthetase, LuxE [Rhodospirillaceae bacterium LM-1]